MNSAGAGEEGSIGQCALRLLKPRPAGSSPAVSRKRRESFKDSAIMPWLTEAVRAKGCALLHS
jgi:hypothetical protein